MRDRTCFGLRVGLNTLNDVMRPATSALPSSSMRIFLCLIYSTAIGEHGHNQEFAVVQE
ncbi:hypothetical protein BDR04DRAFT_1111844 [Suillus decipiens]|nr:hypothetical protein BDR04DRAFT_1111844 [Suillus decipiens]